MWKNGDKSEKVKMTWEDFDKASEVLAKMITRWEKDHKHDFKGIYCIPRGGYCLGVKLSHITGIPLSHIHYQPDILIVDEICDKGKTLYFHMKHNFPTVKSAVWHLRSGSIYKPDFVAEKISHKKFIVYPWERWSNDLEESEKRI